MALRADTARHIITGVTVLVFSAAAIGTAMRYQGRGAVSLVPDGAEPEALATVSATETTGSTGPARFMDRMPGSGREIGVQLDGLSAGAGDAALWPFRGGASAANHGAGAAWWGKTGSRLTPTAGRSSGGAGSGGMSGGGGGAGVSGHVQGKKPASGAPPAAASKSAKGSSGGSSGGGGGSSAPAADPVFDEHSASVGDVLNGGDGVNIGGIPGGGSALVGGVGNLAATPEPASLFLMATGLAGVLHAVRRRRQSRQR